MWKLTTYVTIGIFAGLNSASWGAYKDSPYEGFKPRKYVRSIFFAVFASIWLYYIFQLAGINIKNCSFLFFAIIAFERIFTETFKLFIRKPEIRKYKIPQTIHVFGRVIKNNSLRILIGLCFITASLFLFFIPSIIDKTKVHTLQRASLYGMIGGLLVAIAGAWKDAPFEGFQPLKFLRSPFIGTIVGIIFSFIFILRPSLFLFSVMGGERVTTEFYKSFISKKVPGKFKFKKPVYKSMTKKRKWLIFVYSFTMLAFIVFMIRDLLSG